MSGWDLCGVDQPESDVLDYFPACPHCGDPVPIADNEVSELRRTGVVRRNSATCPNCQESMYQVVRRVRVSIRK